jgi:hypothetical protein
MFGASGDSQLGISHLKIYLQFKLSIKDNLNKKHIESY